MKRRTLAAVLVCINLPGAVALVEGVSFYERHRSSGVMTVAGEERGYVLHVPEGLDRSRPVPLVISLHGAGLWGGAQRDISRWNDVADREGFIVAYPSGKGHASPRVWRMGGGPGTARDVEFITRLIDTLVARHGVDRERVYLNGLSNGGGMTFAFSCIAPERIAAAGMVGSALSFPWKQCAEAAPLPVMIVNGTADPVIPYEGGKTWVASFAFPSVPQFTARWAQRNRCRPSPHDSVVGPTVKRREYRGCAGGASVVLYTLEGDGHVWPGGGRVPEWLSGTDSRNLDASRVMWDFFRGRQRRTSPR
jgi:polyhydroxybutyrate depolymerase